MHRTYTTCRLKSHLKLAVTLLVVVSLTAGSALSRSHDPSYKQEAAERIARARATTQSN